MCQEVSNISKIGFKLSKNVSFLNLSKGFKDTYLASDFVEDIIDDFDGIGIGEKLITCNIEIYQSLCPLNMVLNVHFLHF